MKRFAASLLALLLLVSLCACAGTGSAGSGTPSEALEGQAQNAPDEQSRNEIDTQPQNEPAEQPQIEPDSQPQNEPEAPAQSAAETRAVSLALPFMETEDYVGFWSLGSVEAARVSLRVPADWSEEAGLFYCPTEGGTRKILEPVCLLRETDEAQWASLAQFNVAEDYGEVEYLSVTQGADANGRPCIFLLGKSWPEGDGAIVVWYPCTCYLRDPSGLTAVLIYYLSDPEDGAAMAEFRAVIDSFRFE